MPNVRQLAKYAGVSIATVSRALNGHPRVSPETRARILALADELHYHPNRKAQSVMTGAHATLGFMLPSVTDTFHARVLSGVLNRAHAEAYQVLIIETHNDFPRTLQGLTACIEQRVAGIFTCTPCAAVIPAEIIFAIRSHNIPLVSIDTARFALPVDAIRTDEEELASIAVRCLCGLGHQRIGYYGLPMQYDAGDRGEAVRRVLQRQGLYVPGWMYTTESTEDLFASWRQSDPRQRLSAIIVWNDYYALSLMRRLRQHGLRIPEDISILGYGTFPFSGLVSPALTSIEQYPERMANAAFDILLQRLRADVFTPDPPIIRSVPASLALHESCAAPP